MTPQEIEDRFIRSLDVPMTATEKEFFMNELRDKTTLVKTLTDHKKIREVLQSHPPSSFGFFFASKLVARIENTGVVIERQIFSFFKKYQLVAAGVVVALLILNTVFSDQLTVDSIFGLENTTTTPLDEEIVSFDFYKALNNEL
jgi:hypothetical protein